MVTQHILLKMMVHLRLKSLLLGAYFLVSMVVHCPFIPCLSVIEFCRIKFVVIV